MKSLACIIYLAEDLTFVNVFFEFPFEFRFPQGFIVISIIKNVRFTEYKEVIDGVEILICVIKRLFCTEVPLDKLLLVSCQD
jgi:hypothetical protein